MQAVYVHITLCAVWHASNSTHVVVPLCPTITEYCSCTIHKVKVSKPFKLWTKYVFNTDTAASIRSQWWCLLLVVSTYVACTQSSFYHFRMVVTHTTFGLLAVATFLELSNMPTADWIRGETVNVVKVDDLLSRLHA